MALIIDAAKNIIDTGAATARTLRPPALDPLPTDPSVPAPLDVGTSTVPKKRVPRFNNDPTRKAD